MANAAQKVRQAAKDVIEDESYLVLALAKRDVPIATSALKNSGKVEGSGFQWRVRFGGPKVRYAIPVHERTDVRHAVGKAFFLKDALDYVEKTLKAKIAAAVAAATGKG